MNCRVRIVCLGIASCLALPVLATAEEWPVTTGEGFSFTEVRDGVWHVQGTGAVAAGSNGALVVGENDVLLVDSHMTPAAARALLKDLPLVTDKPIRYVVNTHFHFDHVQGNQVFGPEVEIVAHEWTHQRIAAGDTRRGRGYDFFIGTIPGRLEELERRLEEAPAEERAEIEANLGFMRALWEQDQETQLVQPTLALRQAISLFRGGREIRVLFFGRGHTGGDVVVYLPQERVLVTGDLITEGVPYMGDGHLLEWAETLEAVKALEIDVILPGHGNALQGAERIEHLQGYLRELWHKAVEMHGRGVAADEAAGTIDMSGHAEHYEQIEGPGVDAHAVERVYELLDEQSGDTDDRAAVSKSSG